MPDLTPNGLAVELGVVIGKAGRNISEEQADSHIAGYGEQVLASSRPRF